MNHFDFAIIGGDQRQHYLHSLLLEHGYSVICYGITPSSAIMANSLDEALQQTRTLIAPIPFSRDGTVLTQLSGENPVFIHKLIKLLNSTYTIIGGSIPSNISTHFHCIDLMKQETFVTANSIATAEAAVATAILHIPDNLCECPCLITGYGYCAKALANCLSQFHTKITISARSVASLKEASLHGFQAIPLSELKCSLSSYSVIFNTIPSPIFSEDMIMECSPSSLYLELASAPGGIVQATDSTLSILQCPGLPGRFAPLASAKAIFQQIIHL